MTPQDTSRPNDDAFDGLDELTRKALTKEGVIIPKTVEEVRQAKARLKALPVTVPPHLHDPGVVLKRMESKMLSKVIAPALLASIIPTLSIPVNTTTGKAEIRHKKGSIFFRRAAFDAYVVHTLKGDINLGRTKIEKITHITEYYCGVDFEREPVRDAAGPVDYVSRRKVESLAKKQGWFSVEKAENRYGFKYVPGAKISDALPVAIRTMGAQKNAIDALLELFRPLDTNSCEVVATLFAAWNDLLLTGVEPTDEKIFFEARENWHPKKLSIPMQKWQRALNWMRKQNLVPKGRGRRVPRAN